MGVSEVKLAYFGCLLWVSLFEASTKFVPKALGLRIGFSLQYLTTSLVNLLPLLL